jgi:hypothetical protein
MAAHPESPERTDTTASPIDQHAAPVADHATAGGGRHDGRATAAMIISIISIPLALLAPILGLPPAIVGLVLGIVVMKDIAKTGKRGYGQAKAGFICGIIGVAVAILNAIAGAIMFANNA